jgi:hypothetical protein
MLNMQFVLSLQQIRALTCGILNVYHVCNNPKWVVIFCLKNLSFGLKVGMVITCQILNLS